MLPPFSLIDIDKDDPVARQAAKSQTQRARKEGRLKQQPCVVCQTTVDICAHHFDYSKPLDVVFLCNCHHLRFHAYMRRRLDELEYPPYTKAFHDQALAKFKRDYLEPPLFAKPKLPLRKKFKRPSPSPSGLYEDKFQLRTIRQVAELIGKPKQFVRGLIHHGKIAYYKFGERSSYHISLPDLNTWLTSNPEFVAKPTMEVR
jgi:excisionase family DNA binding protein